MKVRQLLRYRTIPCKDCAGKTDYAKFGNDFSGMILKIAFPCVILFSLILLAACSSIKGDEDLNVVFTAYDTSIRNLDESGYDLSITIDRVPTSSFSNDIQNVPEIIKQQFLNSDHYANQLPNCWYKKFEEANLAKEYIGYDLLHVISWSADELETSLCVTGDKEGQLLQLELETEYYIGDIHLQAFANFFTENYTNDITISRRSTENIKFQETVFTTKNQKQCYSISSTALDSGHLYIDGYIVDDSVLYNLHIVYLEKDADQAEALLRQWGNLF